MNKHGSVCCDECGRSVAKIHRVYEGHRYCVTCYNRVFKPRTCAGCGERKRLPRNLPDAICSACKTSKPCVRCGRVGSPIGRMSDYGPVCNSCSPHFRPEKPCEGCGKPSSELSRVTRLQNDLRLCPACQRSDYETCPGCRRYRLLFEGDNGARLCKSCLQHHDRQCTTCMKPIAGGRGSRCEDCYWIAAAHKRIGIDRHVFSSLPMSTLFVKFGEWLISECGGKNAALSIHRYLSFFTEVENVWGRFPSYESLVGYFKAEGLRRVRRPMRWLETHQKLCIDSAIRESTSEEDRIFRMSVIFSGEVIAGQAVTGYLKKLRIREQQGKTSLRSIRLALTPAIHLLQCASTTGQVLPNQKTLDDYLAVHPGQQAAVTGFINHLNTTFSLELAPYVDDARVAALRKKRLEKRLRSFISGEGLTVTNANAWMPIALEYFHKIRVSRKRLFPAQERIVSQDVNSVTVLLDGLYYYLPIYAGGLSARAT